MQFKYSIVHKDGRLHSAADALSRYPIEGQSVSPLEVNLVTQRNQNGLQEGQRSEWVNVYVNREKGKETTNYVIYNELLFQMRLTDNEPGEVTLRLCVPKALREDVLRVCHDYIMEGHLRRN
jgi:hypothetical protein